MNTIKTFKSKIAYILSIVFLLSAFSSCTSDDTELKAERKFDLSTAKEGLKIVKTLPKVNYKKFKSGNEIDKIGLTKAINNQVGENVLDIRVFDNINTYKKSTENELDTEILESFSIDWENNGIDNAILNLNNLLNEKNVDNTVFEKYNSFSNILLLSEINFQNQAKNSNYQAKNG
jgi:membrane-associated protease RseP (regulator of RpoE activity)